MIDIRLVGYLPASYGSPTKVQRFQHLSPAQSVWIDNETDKESAYRRNRRMPCKPVRIDFWSFKLPGTPWNRP